MRDEVNEYRRKAYQIEAIQFNGANIDAIREFVGKKLTAYNQKFMQLYITHPDMGMIEVPKDFYVIKRGENFSIQHPDLFDDYYEEDI